MNQSVAIFFFFKEKKHPAKNKNVNFKHWKPRSQKIPVFLAPHCLGKRRRTDSLLVNAWGLATHREEFTYILYQRTVLLLKEGWSSLFPLNYATHITDWTLDCGKQERPKWSHPAKKKMHVCAGLLFWLREKRKEELNQNKPVKWMGQSLSLKTNPMIYGQSHDLRGQTGLALSFFSFLTSEVGKTVHSQEWATHKSFIGLMLSLF